MESNLYGIGYIDGQDRTSLTNLDIPENFFDGNIVKMLGTGNYTYVFTDKNKLYRKSASYSTNNLTGFIEILTNINITNFINGYYVLSDSILYDINGKVIDTNIERVLETDFNTYSFIVYKKGDGVYHMIEDNTNLTNLVNYNKEWTGATLLTSSGSGSSRIRNVILYNENELTTWTSSVIYTAPKPIKKVITRDISTASHLPLILFKDGTLAQGTNFSDVSNIFTESKYYDIVNCTVVSFCNYTILVGEDSVTFYKNYGSYGTTKKIPFTGKYVISPWTMINERRNGSVWNTYVSYVLVTNIITYEWDIYRGEDKLVTLETKPALSAYLTVNDNIGTLRVTDILGGNVNANFNIDAPKGYGLGGLAINKEAVTPDIPVNEKTLLYGIGEDLDLYIIYQKELPADAVQATLYYNSAEPNRINKRNFLTKYKDIVGVFRSSVSIEDPVLVLELNEFPSFNYVYIKNFNRYYFVRGRDNISKNIYSLTLHVDPLYSFINEIGNNTAILSRTSNVSLQSPNLVDNKLPIQNNEEIEVIYEDEMDPPTFNIDNANWNNVYRYVLTCFSAKDLVPVSEQQQ